MGGIARPEGTDLPGPSAFRREAVVEDSSRVRRDEAGLRCLAAASILEDHLARLGCGLEPVRRYNDLKGDLFPQETCSCGQTIPVTAAQAGTITATLTTTSQPATMIGVGMGVRNGGGTGCLLNTSLTAEAGSSPQLSSQVDAGDYCVKLFDVGTLTTPMSFTLALVYP